MDKTVLLEIEHKYLIQMPDKDILCTAGKRIDIVQNYLISDGNTFGRRVRRSETRDSVTCTYTRKRQVSSLIREEDEVFISQEEYDSLLQEVDNTRNPIIKTRWLIPYEGHLLEIDIYPFWGDRAILEIELSSVDEPFNIPNWINIIREVSDDPRYYNAALAKSPVFEEI